jgi:hypothetical protein
MLSVKVRFTGDETDPDRVQAQIEDDHRFPGIILCLLIDLDEDERPYLRQLTVRAEGDDGYQQVSSQDLRSIPVREVVRDVMAARRGDEGGLDAELRVTAEVHQLAAKAGEDPLMAVARALGLSRSTASNRIRDARIAGLLPWPRRSLLRSLLQDRQAV